MTILHLLLYNHITPKCLLIVTEMKLLPQPGQKLPVSKVTILRGYKVNSNFLTEIREHYSIEFR